MQFRTFISLTAFPEIFPVICICWLLGWSISGINFIFVVFFSCMNFFCFSLSLLSALASFFHLYPPIQSPLLLSFEKFLNSGLLKSSFLVFQGHRRLFCVCRPLFFFPLFLPLFSPWCDRVLANEFWVRMMYASHRNPYAFFSPLTIGWMWGMERTKGPSPLRLWGWTLT